MRDLERSSDAQLLAEARGNPEAFTAFYRRHERLVLRFLMSRCRDAELAADLAAETFAIVLESASDFDPGRSPGGSAVPWILAIARNALHASVRRGVVADDARRRLGFEPMILADEDLTRVEELASVAPGLDGALQELSPALREAVVARVLEERDYKEIAARLGCSELVVRKRVSRGLSRLRAAFAPSNP